MNFKSSSLVFFFFFGGLISLFAQKKIETQELIWLGYTIQSPLSSNWGVRAEVQNRVYINPFRQHQFVVRSALERKWGKHVVTGLGFTYFVQSLPHNPEVQDYFNRTELRPQLELTFKQPLDNKFSLSHRYWAEFRIFEQDDASFDYGNTRIRYKLELKYKASALWLVKIFDEIHFNLGKNVVYNVFDQNRAGFSIQYQLSPAITLEGGYFNWFQQRNSGQDFFNRHILKFNVLHSLGSS